MNIYITTTIFSKSGLESCREDAMEWKRHLMDMCINSIKNQNGLTIKGIITPERLNPNKTKTYRSIPVQSVKTTVNEDKEDFDRCSVVTQSIENHQKYCKPTEALAWPKDIPLRSPRYLEDNEHALLFMNMDIKPPCFVIDCDCIMIRYKYAKLNKSMIIGKPSHLIFIHKKGDASKIFLNEKLFRFNSRGYLNSHKAPKFIHFSDNVVRKLRELDAALIF